MGPTPFYGARAEKTQKKAHFAMKQTNICRLSGDINDDDDDNSLLVVVGVLVVIRFPIYQGFFSISQPIVIKLRIQIEDNILHNHRYRTVSDFQVT